MTNYEQWKEICAKYCIQNNYELLFVNDDNFGYSDNEGNLHHVYVDELYVKMGGK